MLKTLQQPANSLNSKCAEIHCYNANRLAITCVHCDFITNALEQFSQHFQELHQAVTKSVDTNSVHETIKVEILENLETVTDAANKTAFEEELAAEATEKDASLCHLNYVDEMEKETAQDSIYNAALDDTVDEFEQIVFKQEPNFEPEECLMKLEVEVNIPSEEDAFKDSNLTEESQEENPKTIATTSNKNFKCKHCGRPFRLKSNCTAHELRHNAKGQFQCEHCDKSFYTQCERRNHERWHNDERTYMCEECGKAFRHSWVLQKHRRTHVKQQPTLPCPECGKLFSYKDNLRNHIATHNTEPNYECQHCNQCFTQSKHLWRHTRRYHKDSSATKS